MSQIIAYLLTNPVSQLIACLHNKTETLYSTLLPSNLLLSSLLSEVGAGVPSRHLMAKVSFYWDTNSDKIQQKGERQKAKGEKDKYKERDTFKKMAGGGVP